jgi:hypothetical protein
MIKSVLLPQTYLARDMSETLAHCFDEVYLLRPPGLTQEQGEMTDGPPEVFKILEVSENSEDIGSATGLIAGFDASLGGVDIQPWRHR